MGEVKEINIKNRTYYFYNDIIDLKLMIMKEFTVWILCIYLLAMQTDILKKNT